MRTSTATAILPSPSRLTTLTSTRRAPRPVTPAAPHTRHRPRQIAQLISTTGTREASLSDGCTDNRVTRKSTDGFGTAREQALRRCHGTERCLDRFVAG